MTSGAPAAAERARAPPRASARRSTPGAAATACRRRSRRSRGGGPAKAARARVELAEQRRRRSASSRRLRAGARRDDREVAVGADALAERNVRRRRRRESPIARELTRRPGASPVPSRARAALRPGPAAPPRELAGARSVMLPNGLGVLLREMRTRAGRRGPGLGARRLGRRAARRGGPRPLPRAHALQGHRARAASARSPARSRARAAASTPTPASTPPSTTRRCRRPSSAAGIDVLADAVQHSVFDPAEIAREVEVVLEEIRRVRGLAAPRARPTRVFATAFRAHPYRAPILGSRASVRSLHARARARASSSAGTRRRTSPSWLTGDLRRRTPRSRAVERAFAGVAARRRAQRARQAEPPQREIRTLC